MSSLHKHVNKHLHKYHHKKEHHAHQKHEHKSHEHQAVASTAKLPDYSTHVLEHEKVTDTADFNSLRTYEAFKACICEDGVNVNLPQLIVAYRELIK